MDFEVRNELAVMLQDDPVAFQMAIAEVDSEEKLVVFKRKYQECYGQAHSHEQRVSICLPIFKETWKQLYEVQE
ncbi:MAG: hypothetical protein ACRCXB_34205 [Aeromonadaceae bacterium]